MSDRLIKKDKRHYKIDFERGLSPLNACIVSHLSGDVNICDGYIQLVISYDGHWLKENRYHSLEEVEEYIEESFDLYLDIAKYIDKKMNDYRTQLCVDIFVNLVGRR